LCTKFGVQTTTPGSKYSFYINTQSLGYLPSINARYGNETGGIDFTCYGNGVCGNASTTKIFADGVNAYPVSNKFCDNGTPNPKTPGFPTVAKPVTWYCLGSDNTIETDDALCSAYKGAPTTIKGVCGDAVRIYPDNATGYAPYNFCSKEMSSSPKPAFPLPGKSVSWTCLGSDNATTTDDAVCSASRSNINYTNVQESIIEKFENQPTSRIVNIGSKCKIDWKIKDNAVAYLTNLVCYVTPAGGSSISVASKTGVYESPTLSHMTDFTLSCSGKNSAGNTVEDDAPATCYVAPGVREI